MIGQRHLYERHHPLECVWSSAWRDNTPRIGEPHALVQDPYTKSWAHDLVCDCPVGGVIRQQIGGLDEMKLLDQDGANEISHGPTVDQCMGGVLCLFNLRCFTREYRVEATFIATVRH